MQAVTFRHLALLLPLLGVGCLLAAGAGCSAGTDRQQHKGDSGPAGEDGGGSIPADAGASGGRRDGETGDGGEDAPDAGAGPYDGGGAGAGDGGDGGRTDGDGGDAGDEDGGGAGRSDCGGRDCGEGDCGAEDCAGPDGGDEPRQPVELTIGVWKPDWPRVYLHYRLSGQAWTEPPGEAMQQEADSWWTGRTPPGTGLEFVFTDGADAWYPGGAANDFLTTWPATYVKDGLIFTYRPGAERPAGELVVLTINLHTYQEADAAAKLDRVADVIAALQADFVCLQECAQHRNAAVVVDPAAFSPFPGEPIREDNMARRIAARLQEQHDRAYRYGWTWAHHGWNVWEEGVAVLTPHPILAQESRWISTARGTNTIDSRKAVLLAADVPGFGRIHVISTHTSWGADQATQFGNLKAFLAEQAGAAPSPPLASLLCGDFNAPAGEAGYAQLVSPAGGRLVDSYLEANPGHGSDPTMPSDGTRIDYIFYDEGAPLKTRTSQIYFKHHPLLGGRVSDHFGVISRLAQR